MSIRSSVTSIDIAAACDSFVSSFVRTRNKLKVFHQTCVGWSIDAALAHDVSLTNGEKETIDLQRKDVDMFIVANIENDKSALANPLLIAVDVRAIAASLYYYDKVIEETTAFIHGFKSIEKAMNRHNLNYFKPRVVTGKYIELIEVAKCFETETHYLRQALKAYLLMAPASKSCLTHTLTTIKAFEGLEKAIDALYGAHHQSVINSYSKRIAKETLSRFY